MRIEATIPDPRGEQLQQLADELKVSRSQLVEEALALFLTAATEARGGRRVAIIEAESRAQVREVVSPSLSQLEWAAHVEKIALSRRGVRRVAELIGRPPTPTPALRRALSRRR